MYALDKEGKIYAWGYNYSGQLGDGTTTNRSTPICISEISGNPLKNKKIVKISGGLYSNAVALDEEGKVYTWGDNYYGQLGDGTTTNSSTPICISNIEGSMLQGKKITDIYTDYHFVIAKDVNGEIYAWGDNFNGQLGNGTTEDSSIPICISNIEGSKIQGQNITDIYITGSTVIAKDINGKLYAWGANYKGMLGNGTTEDSGIPICISEIEESPLKGKKIVKLFFSRAIRALDDNGVLYIWGRS